jgi:uncharacterized membrane protein YsdA (DUF1294 family)/cold shock CspA family protein
MRFDGTIKTWNDERGFGFIAPTQGGQEIFVHAKAFNGRGARPQVGQAVTFEVERNHEGKKRAKAVEPLRIARAAPVRGRGGSTQWGAATYFAIPVFLVVYFAAAMLWRVPTWAAGVYVGASVLAFVIYGVDKSAAVADTWRVSESTLLVVGLIGGWPGAIVAQQVLRHKSSKASFRSAFWGTVVLNIAAFLIVFSPLGKQIVST